MSKHVWGYWDCSCGRKHIRGDTTECPGCGLPRLAGIKFYLDLSDKEYVESEQVNINPNWICDYCGAQNDSRASVCAQCGASREHQSKTYFDIKVKADTTPNPEPSEDLESAPAPAPAPAPTPKSSQHMSIPKILRFRELSHRAKIIAISIPLAVLFVISMLWLFTPVEHQMIIDSFSWQRSIAIEELRTFNESGWSLPGDARLQYTQTEFHHNEQVLDHYETKTRSVAKQRISGYETRVTGYKDLGNGQFEEETAREPVYETYYETETYQEPVYKDVPQYWTKYYYEVDRWVHERSVTTSDSGKSPYWGQVSLAGDEREGHRSEKYFILGNLNDKTKKFSLSFSDWNSLQKGDTITFSTFRFGSAILNVKGVTSCIEV